MFNQNTALNSKMNQKKKEELKQFALMDNTTVLEKMESRASGLTRPESAIRFEKYGKNEVATQKPKKWYVILGKAFIDPFVIVLAALMIVSFLTGDIDGAAVMMLMILLSVITRFVQEFRSQKASEALKEMIENTCAVTRAGVTTEIPMNEVVPGDIVSLTTGDMIPADSRLLVTKDLFVNQSSLTGESLPIEKTAILTKKNLDSADTTTFDYVNLVFMGTDVLSGSGTALILKTGNQTFFGDIAKNATKQRSQTSFDTGLLKVSRLLIMMMVVLTPIVFLLNWATKGNVLSAFFFAIAVAVGLTPEMLPMIVTSNLAKGAINLSKKKVIVKELNAIQNLGAMNVLCTDKTGTITEDRVVLVKHVNPMGDENDRVLQLSYMNANYQTGWHNLLDQAIINYYNDDKNKSARETFPKGLEKIDELPFDFDRRKMTVVVKNVDHTWMVTKGAFEEMIAISNRVEVEGEVKQLTPDLKQQLIDLNDEMNNNGMRVIAVSYRIDAHAQSVYTKDDEQNMVLAGFMGFLDPEKQSAKVAITQLHQHGVTVKVLTGDNAIISKHVAANVGIPVDEGLLQGSEIDNLSDDELKKEVLTKNLFVKLNPMQKSRIISILQSQKQIVGFMGDGINDAPALRQADVGISVDNAADITKDASGIILLEKNLLVLEDGILEGRKVFVNMMKYINMTISSNFGNVLSVLVASAFLPFLPMLSTQLLVQNLIYDLSQLSIPFDNVDADAIKKPTVWQTGGLLRFTVWFGPTSSIFDIVTFLFLWFGLGINTVGQAHVFQAGWFMVGLFTQSLVIYLFRTQKVPFFKSKASSAVYFSTVMVIITGLFITLSPIHVAFDFALLPNMYWIGMFFIIIGYLILVDVVKKAYIKKIGHFIV